MAAAQGIEMEGLGRLGVGFPVPFDIDSDRVVSNVVTPRAFPGWKQVPVVDRIKDRLACPVVLENSATAAAIGKRWYRESHPRSTFFYLFSGVRLGGGMICEGHPYEGFFGNAGEVGHIPTMTATTKVPDRPSHIGEGLTLPRLYSHLEEHGSSASRPSDLAPLHEEGASPRRDWMKTAIPDLKRPRQEKMPLPPTWQHFLSTNFLPPLTASSKRNGTMARRSPIESAHCSLVLLKLPPSRTASLALSAG